MRGRKCCFRVLYYYEPCRKSPCHIPLLSSNERNLRLLESLSQRFDNLSDFCTKQRGVMMAPLFFFLSGRCHATRSVRTSFCCTINRTLLPYQQSSVDTATKVLHPYGNRPPSRLSAPQYGRNEQQVTGEAH